MRMLTKLLLDKLSNNAGFIAYGVIKFSDYQLATSFQRKGYDFSKTIISFALPYENKVPTVKDNEFLFAKFAYGSDYHKVVYDKIDGIRQALEDQFGKFQYSINVDTNNLDEKQIAAMAGIGFIGRNTLIISRQHGSFFVLGELCLDIESEFYTTSIQNGCHHCKRCVDACPTNAIGMDASMFSRDACLSHLTQRKLSFDEKAFSSLKDTIFGCDICQNVCPYNHKIRSHDEKLSLDDLSITTLDTFINMTKEEYDKIYSDKTYHYLRYEVILRNILIASINKNQIDEALLDHILQKYQHLPWMVQVVCQAKERMRQIG